MNKEDSMADENSVGVPVKVPKEKGISAYIKQQLLALQSDQAISFEGLVKDLREKFPHIKDNTGASARINLVLKQKKIVVDFKKYKRVISDPEAKKDHTEIWIVQKDEKEKEFDRQVVAAAAVVVVKEPEKVPEPPAAVSNTVVPVLS